MTDIHYTLRNSQCLPLFSTATWNFPKATLNSWEKVFKQFSLPAIIFFGAFKECNSLYITVLSDVLIVANVVVLCAP